MAYGHEQFLNPLQFSLSVFTTWIITLKCPPFSTQQLLHDELSLSLMSVLWSYFFNSRLPSTSDYFCMSPHILEPSFIYFVHLHSFLYFLNSLNKNPRFPWLNSLSHIFLLISLNITAWPKPRQSVLHCVRLLSHKHLRIIIRCWCPQFLSKQEEPYTARTLNIHCTTHPTEGARIT